MLTAETNRNFSADKIYNSDKYEYIDNYRLVTTFSSIGFNQLLMYSNQSIFIDSYLVL